jgi:hypothetical protein
MSEEIDAKLLHHALTEERRENGLTVRARKSEQQRESHPSRGPPRHRRVAGGDRNVDHVLREQRAGELKHTFRHQQRERGGHKCGVRSGVRDQTSHEAGVVAAT